MNISGFDFPEDLLYDEEKHVWVKEEGDEIKVGITSLGQYMAGKIFQVSTKNEGEEVTPRSTIFSVESAKWIGKFRLPINGKIIEVNKEVIDNPGIINEKPYDAWIVKIKVESFTKKLKTLSEAAEKFKEEAERVAR
jgi:glycine cleavage system H lipoate-binding protein